MKKNIKQLSAIFLSMALALSTTACGGNATSASSSAETSSEAASKTAAESSAANTEKEASETSAADSTDATVTYPLTVTDQLGREVTIEKEPESLVSGYYITTSLMIALGLDEKLVGVEAKADTRNIYKLSAPEILDLPSVGTAKEFDLEGCASLKPDLVIVPAKLKDSIPAMEELGLTVLAVKPENQDLLFDAIDLIDQATNTVSEGEKLKSYITDSLENLEKTLSAAENTPSVYLGGNSALLETAGPAMYQSSLIEHAKGTNAAAEISDSYWAEVSYEQILSWNPDYIVLASDASYTTDSVLGDSALADCTAVKDGHVVKLPDDIEALDSPVPGSFLGSIYLASVLHPDLVSEEDYQKTASDFYETFYGFTPEVNAQ
ncbi:ABC transporter substrate-binding protein [Brotaphodocola sp.]|uniref:ABC transporter substrate-binding protein n=1 Tax=Brotaphodocola sp. TaxID=3073577 RepID=UPI003D7C6B80